MKVYFDESYPETQEVMIQGAIFCSDDANTLLHQSFLAIKKKYGITSELKYYALKSNKMLSAAKEAAGLFLNLSEPFYHACVLPYDENGLRSIPGNDLSKKRIGIYVDSGTKLILDHLPPNTNADVFLDEELRVSQTKFYQKLKNTKLQNGAKVNSVTPVKSERDETCLVQLADLLIGTIKHNLYPTTGKKGRFKRAFCEYVLQTAKIPTFARSYWTKNKRKNNKKFSVGYWIVPNYYLYRRIMRRKKQQKSRS